MWTNLFFIECQGTCRFVTLMTRGEEGQLSLMHADTQAESKTDEPGEWNGD